MGLKIYEHESDYTIELKNDQKKIEILVDEAEIDGLSGGIFLKHTGWYRVKLRKDQDGNWWIMRDQDVLQGDENLRMFKMRISKDHAKQILQEFDVWGEL